MPAGITLNRYQDWRPPDWIFRNLLAELHFLLHPEFCMVPCAEAGDALYTLRPQFESALDDPEVGLDLSGLSLSGMQTVYKAVDLALESTRAKGAKRWCDPASFPEYVSWIEALLRTMESDPRVIAYRPDRG